MTTGWQEETVSVRTVLASEMPDVIEVLALAFESDPLFRFLLPEPATRVAWLRFVMGAMITLNEPTGIVTGVGATDALSATIAVAPPARHGTSYRSLVRYLLRRSTWSAGRPSLRFLARATRLLALIDRMHPKDPHYYVACLGVRPDQQGRGFGRALLASSLALADRDRVPTYLETSNPKNLAFYGNVGFDIEAEVSLPGYPPVWTMLRRAHS